MNTVHLITNKTLDLKTISEVILEGKQLKLSDEAITRIENCRRYLDEKMETHSEPIYGINTGFGSLYNVKITSKNLTKLQENLMKSHACGTGDMVPEEIVKLMLLLKIQSLSYGHSGIQLKTVNRLIEFYNNNVLPVIYTQGSLGASGDLAPLAHLALPLIGEGEVIYNGEIKHASEINAKFSWQPIQLQSKEGLALLNGTQFMSAYGIHLLLKSYKLSYFADLIGAMKVSAGNDFIFSYKYIRVISY